MAFSQYISIAGQPGRTRVALGVAGGKTQADAYREAYPRSKKWKDEAVYVKASEMMTNGKVLVRVAELKDRITETGIASAARVLQEASRLALFGSAQAVSQRWQPSL